VCKIVVVIGIGIRIQDQFILKLLLLREGEKFANTITHEPLQLTWRNFARTCVSTRSRVSFCAFMWAWYWRAVLSLERGFYLLIKWLIRAASSRSVPVSSRWQRKVQQTTLYRPSPGDNSTNASAQLYSSASSCDTGRKYRDAREWLFTFPLPPIPVQSIPIPSHSHFQFCNQSPFPWNSHKAFPIPSHSHSRTLHRRSINYFGAREDSSLNMPLKLTISCVHFYSAETRKIVVENL